MGEIYNILKIERGKENIGLLQRVRCGEKDRERESEEARYERERK